MTHKQSYLTISYSTPCKKRLLSLLLLMASREKYSVTPCALVLSTSMNSIVGSDKNTNCKQQKLMKQQSEMASRILEKPAPPAADNTIDLAFEYCELRRVGKEVDLNQYLHRCPNAAAREEFTELVNADLLLSLALSGGFRNDN